MFEDFYKAELHKPFDEYLDACVKNALFYCVEPILKELAETSDEHRFVFLQNELTRAYQFVEYEMSVFFKEAYQKHLH